VVSLFILMVAAFVLQQAKDHKVLNFWARATMVLTVIQVFLGIGVFTVRSLQQMDETTILTVAAAHVTTGALLFSASTVLGMQIRRNVRPKSR
jgi:heme A synthase